MKMKNIQYDTVGTYPKSNIKLVYWGKIDKPNTQIYKNTFIFKDF